MSLWYLKYNVAGISYSSLIHITTFHSVHSSAPTALALVCPASQPASSSPKPVRQESFSSASTPSHPHSLVLAVSHSTPKGPPLSVMMRTEEHPGTGSSFQSQAPAVSAVSSSHPYSPHLHRLPNLCQTILKGPMGVWMVVVQGRQVEAGLQFREVNPDP